MYKLLLVKYNVSIALLLEICTFLSIVCSPTEVSETNYKII